MTIAWAPADTLAAISSVKLHGFGVAERQNQGSAGPMFGADRTEQIGRLGSLIAWLGDASPSWPSDKTLFFWPTRISSWNQTSTGVPGASLARTSATRSASFFERLHGVRDPACRLSGRAHMREAQVLQGAVDGVVRNRQPKLLVQPHDQIARPPAHPHRRPLGSVRPPTSRTRNARCFLPSRWRAR